MISGRPGSVRDRLPWKRALKRRVPPANAGANACTTRFQRTPLPEYLHPGSETTRSSARPTRIPEGWRWIGVIAITVRCAERTSARLGGLAFLAQHFDALNHELQPVLSPFRAGHGFLDAEKEFGIVELGAQFFDDGMDLGVNEEKLSAEARLQEQFLVEHALQHKRGDDAPVAADLAQPCIFLRAECPADLEEIVGRLREKFSGPPEAGFAHFRFAAEVVELQDQLCVGGGWLLRHTLSSCAIWQMGNVVVRKERGVKPSPPRSPSEDPAKKAPEFPVAGYAVVAAASGGGAGRS